MSKLAEEDYNSTFFVVYNNSDDENYFLELENKSDTMGIPGIIATSFILSVMTFITIIGNIFVIIAIFLERNLQSVANYLILSLAMADLLVAILVMPLGAIYQIRLEWTFGPILCDLWTSSDVLCCTASILHLLAIAIDRYWAVTHVHYIHNRTFRTIGTMICIIWLTSFFVSLGPLLGWKDSDFETRVNVRKECIVSQDVGYQIFATLATFYVPLVLILILYWRIFVTARNRLRTRLAQKTSLHSFPERSPNRLRRGSAGHASGTIRMVAIAHLDRNGQGVTHSVASKNRQDTDNHLDSISGGKETVFIANPPDPEVSSGNDEGHNGLAKVDVYTRQSVEDLPSKNELSPTFLESSLLHGHEIVIHAEDISDGQVTVVVTNGYGNVNNGHAKLDDNIDEESGKQSIDNIGVSATSLKPSLFRNGREIGHNPEGDSDGKETDFITIVPEVLNGNGNENVNNGHAKLDDNIDVVSVKGSDNSGVESVDKNGENRHIITPTLHEIVREQGCQTDERNRPQGHSNSILIRRDSARELQQQDTNVEDRQSKKKHVSLEAKRERKAAKTLAIVTGAFIACWLPFFIFALVMAVYKDHEFNRTLVSFFLWLGYFNSTLNPIIYTIFSPEFRLAFQRILCGKIHAVNHWPRHLQ